jgi:hypothetical protein
MILSSLRRSHLTLALPLSVLVQPKSTTARNFTSTTKRMGVQKTTLSPGDGVNFPEVGDTVTMHYVGHLVKSGTGANLVRGDVYEPPATRASKPKLVSNIIEASILRVNAASLSLPRSVSVGSLRVRHELNSGSGLPKQHLARLSLPPSPAELT